jgi:uncharacterized membrane protein YvlD (DUF360 family)
LGLFGWAVSFLFYALTFYLLGDWLQPLGKDFTVNGFGAACVLAFWMAVGNGLLSMALHHPAPDAER